MRRILVGIALTSLMGLGVNAIADDSTSSDHAGKSQAWQDCMARQKASNSSMTEEAMKTVCKNEMKGDKQRQQGNDLATGPQATPKPQD